MAIRKITSMLASAALLACCVSCGDSGDGTEEKNDLSLGNPLAAQTSVLDGKYASVDPIDGNWTSYKTDIDSGLRYAVKSYLNSDIKPLEFSGRSFRMLGSFISKEWSSYSGTYTLNDGKIIFNYEKYHTENVDVDLNEEKPEFDNDIIIQKYKAEALKGLTKDEQTKRIKEEQTKRSISLLHEALQELNKTGTYFNKVSARIMKSDKVNSPGILPIFSVRSPGIMKRRDTPFMLCPVDDFICVETYGMKLDGSYRKGKNFTVNFDPMAPYYDDAYSNYNLEPDSRGRNDEMYQTYLERFFAGSRDTTITFSNGKWTWKNGAGEIVNNGYYMESDEHPGLIGMFIGEDSAHNDKNYQMVCPLLFYIAGDGTIWYPNWVKMD